MTVSSGLTTVNAPLTDIQQTLNSIDQTAATLGDKVEASSPVVNVISNTVGASLFPKINTVATTAITVSQAVVQFNTTLETLNRLPGVELPTLSDQLASISASANQAQVAAEDLQAQVAAMKAGVAQGAVNAVTSLTSKLRNLVTAVQTPVNEGQASVAQAQEKLPTATANLLRAIDIGAITEHTSVHCSRRWAVAADSLRQRTVVGPAAPIGRRTGAGLGIRLPSSGRRQNCTLVQVIH